MPRTDSNEFSIKTIIDRSIPEPNSGCWLWMGFTDKDGYGHVRCSMKTFGAHRFSYIVSFGDIPKNTLVLHKCDNPSCVNPNHLFNGTTQDNVNDKVSKGRHNGWKVFNRKKVLRSENV